jgi:hypothetical protein
MCSSQRCTSPAQESRNGRHFSQFCLDCLLFVFIFTFSGCEKLEHKIATHILLFCIETYLFSFSSLLWKKRTKHQAEIDIEIDITDIAPERLERGSPCWLLLTPKSTNERGPSLVGSLGLSFRYKRFLFCLGCSIGPVQIIFSSAYTISFPLSPYRPGSWAGCCAESPVSEYVSLGKADIISKVTKNRTRKDKSNEQCLATGCRQLSVCRLR